MIAVLNGSTIPPVVGAALDIGPGGLLAGTGGIGTESGIFGFGKKGLIGKLGSGGAGIGCGGGCWPGTGICVVHIVLTGVSHPPVVCFLDLEPVRDPFFTILNVVC